MDSSSGQGAREVEECWMDAAPLSARGLCMRSLVALGILLLFFCGRCEGGSPEMQSTTWVKRRVAATLPVSGLIFCKAPLRSVLKRRCGHQKKKADVSSKSHLGVHVSPCVPLSHLVIEFPLFKRNKKQRHPCLPAKGSDVISLSMP